MNESMNEGHAPEIREPDQDPVTGQVLTPEEIIDQQERRENEGWREQQ